MVAELIVCPHTAFFVPLPEMQVCHLKDLTRMNDRQFLSEFQRDFSGIKILNLSTNDLHQRSISLLLECFQLIPENVDELDLSFNCLGLLDEGFPVFFGVLSGLKCLNLSGNLLVNKTGFELAVAFKNLRSTLQFLDLSSNQFYDLPADDFVLAMQGLSVELKELDLSGNMLGEKSLTDLRSMMLALPSGLRKVILSDNFFSDEQVSCILDCLSDVNEIDMDGKNIQRQSDLNISGVVNR